MVHNKEECAAMDRFMEAAYKEALRGLSKKHGGPFGAVIVKDGAMVAKGHNEVLRRCDPSAHAEIMTIRKACKILGKVDLGDCVLFSTSKPCPMCKGAIQWSRLRKVYFSGDYDDTGKLDFGDSSFSDAFDSEDKSWIQIERESFGMIIDAFEKYRGTIRY